jgi:hypothetical protein
MSIQVSTRVSAVRERVCSRRASIALIVVLALMLVAPGLASANAPAPRWLAISQAAPTAFHPGDSRDYYEVVAINDGGADTVGPITVTDTLPAGVVVNPTNGMNAYAEVAGIQQTSSEPFQGGCEQSGLTVTCRTNSVVPTGRSIVVNINVEVSAGLEPGARLANSVTISGGGAQAATVATTTPVTEPSQPVPFGASLASEVTTADGRLDTEAGGHPFAFTTLTAFNLGAINPNEACNQGLTPSCAEPNAQARDVEVSLPPGLVGNPTAVPYCTQAQFEQQGACPASSQVGMVYLYFFGGFAAVQADALYNIQPPPGQPGELGFSLGPADIPLFFHVRSDGDYGVTVDLSNITQFDAVRMAAFSVWGEPSNSVHDALRFSVLNNCVVFGCPSGVLAPKPFLTLPTSCAAASLSVPLAGDSWQDPQERKRLAGFPSLGESLPVLAESILPPITGCNALQFNPSLETKASTHQAAAPAGYTIDLKVPQNEEPEQLATPDVRDVEVALPQGTVISPSGANGLVSCSESDFQLHSRSAGNCPGASKIATVNVTTPLLENPVKGSLYIGEPECSPCTPAQSGAGQMVRLYLEAGGSGVVIKLAGHTRIDQSTGQLITVFMDNPQLPFSDLQVELESGPNAPLVNPATCGPALATAEVRPWSKPPIGELSEYKVSATAIPIEGCAPEGFAPGFIASRTPTAQAASYTGFHVSISRSDGEQTLSRMSVTTPPGLLGMLKSVVLCGEAQANEGTCPAISQIGTGSIVAGPGSEPLTVPGARVYLTGPYENQPFGLSIVTPTQAGPFLLSGNAGNGTEVIRSSIHVDPHTAALTITSDPLPQALNGIPLDIRAVNIDVNRPQFMFSGTDCDGMQTTATLASATGTLSNVAYPFQTQNCAILPFKPKFSASTQGKASKASGASLHVKVTSGHGQANIAKVKVNLPLQLPSRLTTLQKACIASVFEANPGSCPAASAVGAATAVTPVLAHSLIGPAYLVSHAGAAFPDLEIVLQGEGITLILDGNTQIKKGITSSIFRAVPDAPISSFDLVLPEGPHSVLATNLPAKAKYNLCGRALNMPTVITGQNGAVVRQATKITATGCTKHTTKGKGKKR